MFARCQAPRGRRAQIGVAPCSLGWFFRCSVSFVIVVGAISDKYTHKVCLPGFDLSVGCDLQKFGHVVFVAAPPPRGIFLVTDVPHACAYKCGVVLFQYSGL